MGPEPATSPAIAPKRQPVEDARPPRQVLRIVNPILRLLLRSPLHRFLSKSLMLLTVQGKRTGQTYSLVVGRHQTNRSFLVPASGAWCHNLRGGALVRLTLNGDEHRGYAALVEDPEQVARIYAELLERIGLNRAGMLGLRVNLPRFPTPEEIRPAVASRGIVHVELGEKEELAEEEETRWPNPG
jgi:hypothetical protein